MTFMRNLINLLNMNNWGKKQIEILCENDDSYSTPMNTDDSVVINSHEYFDVKNIYNFYRQYPQNNAFPKDRTQAHEYLLYAKTLILDSYNKPSPIRDTYPAYFLAECNISNPRKLINQLIKEGYLGPPSARDLLNLYKLPELKIICDSIGCKKSGRKAELINRILNNTSPEFVEQYFQDCELYSLTEKGALFLQSNYDYVQLHRFRYNITLHEFNANRFLGNRKRSFEDNIHYIISNRIYHNCLKHNYHYMEFEYRALYEITRSECNYDLAIKYLLTALYLKTCCIHIMTICIYYSDYSMQGQIIFNNTVVIPIVRLSQYYDTRIVDDIYGDLSLPYSFLSLEEFKEAISEMISEISFDSEKYNNIIRNRLEEYIRILPNY